MNHHPSQFRNLNLSIAVIIATVVSIFTLTVADVNAQKVRLRSQVTPNCTPANGSANLKFADIHADGNIAVQGSYNCRGVFIYDLTNPDAPVLASVYDPSPRQAFLEAVVVGNRGYFGSGGPFPNSAPNSGDGVHIVDLTNPYVPVLLGKVNASSGNGFNGIHEMVVHGNYLIENYNSTSNKTLKVIDISNPASPVFKWDFSPIDPLWVHAVHVRGNRMYTSGWNGRLEIYDLTNLATQPPVLIGSILGNFYNHSAWTSEDGNYLYSCRETLDGDLRVYDVRNAAQPLLVRSIKTSELGLNAVSPHNPVVMGNYLYISWYQAGVQVFDLTDPTSPRHVAQYDTYQRAFAPPAEDEQLRAVADAAPWDMVCGASNTQNALPNTYEGNWAVFPFLGQNRILAGDMASGLLVLDASAVSAPLRNRVSDFDGDGKTDLSVFRPASGAWQVQTSGNGAEATRNFGVAGDVVVTGDYDGNGRSEFAVFRPSDGIWYLQTGPSTYSETHWGLAEDIPVAADYDADGRTDIAVFRPSNGVWYILQSTLGIRVVQWGFGTDKPVIGDFEGDGKADITVWRPSEGIWYILQSSSSLPKYYQFGMLGDRPLSADFDGNGITDFAVFRPSNGAWYITDPTAGTARGYQWGLGDDIPIPADYDGDAKADITVFRPSSNEWYRVSSIDGSVHQRTFGLAGDRPSPASVQAK